MSGPPPDGVSMPPPGEEPFIYNVDQVHVLIGLGTTFTALATISVCARIYTRYFIARHVGIDDFMAIGALLTTIAVDVVDNVYAVVYLPAANQLTSDAMDGKLFYIAEILYNFGLAFYKLTFLLQFFRVFRYVYWMRIAYIVAIVVISLWSVLQILLAALSCIPVDANWDRTINRNSVKCLPGYVPTFVNAAGTIVTDIIVLVLPLPTLWSLRLRRSQKWAAFGVFGIGAVVPIISAVRIWSLLTPPPNGFVNQACWRIAELSAGVITAGLATVRLLFSRHFPQLPKTTSSSQSQILAGKHGTLVSKFSNTLSSTTSRTNTQLDSRHTGSEVDLFHGSRFGEAAGTRPQDLGLGVSTTITTGKYDRPMSEGAAEFLGEFGIRVEMNWEVTEMVIRE
ncbi:hypothetical protein BJ170DRAFT_316666 [Xylariales sp. AK1849]|nr:hypothetical protein BJ170DRAFT_316666 [Xylariales sp. AK1849]